MTLMTTMTINVEFWMDFLFAMSGGLSLSIALWFQFVDGRDVHPAYIAIMAFIGSIILLAIVPGYAGLGKGPLFLIELVTIIAIFVFNVAMAWWLNTSSSAVRSPAELKD